MNSPLISIIVPVYQVEKYLEKCINSIISQTYKNLEIILVDDGSTDNCPAICDRFQTEDPRIKVIHQENGGLSHARNIGLEIATGDYIGFVDSDDWIEPNMYEILMSALQETEAYIAVCNRKLEYEDSQSPLTYVKSVERKMYSAEEALRKLIIGDNIIHNTVWDKIYRKNIITNIKFPTGKIYEDYLWTALVIGNSRMIVGIDYLFYHYLIRSSSLSRNDKLAIQRSLDTIEMIEMRTEYIRMHYPNLHNLSLSIFLNSCFREYFNISLNYPHLDVNGENRRHLHQQFCQFGLVNIFKFYGFKTTCGRILFRFSPRLMVKIYSVYQKLLRLKMRINKKT